jgi:hypothetical protein
MNIEEEFSIKWWQVSETCPKSEKLLKNLPSK